MSLQGKTVLITGGAKGVGRVTAHKFVEQGATVVINYFHSHDQARETAQELRALGGTVHLVRASVAKKDHVDRMFAEIGDLVGGIDILINNAAGGALLPHAELEQEHWDRAFDTNFKGSLWCAEHAARMMATRGGGAIVNLSSIGAEFVVDNYMSVGISKATVETMTRYLAVQYAPINVRVNTASCSLIGGEVARRFPHADEMSRAVIAATPLGRMATEADLANVVLFLASDLSGWITGQTIVADGGLTLRVPFTLPIDDVAGPAVPASEEPATASLSPEFEESDLADDDRMIAVVGMGMVVPGASSPQEYWPLRLDGTVMFTEPGERWDGDSYYSADPAAEDRTYARTSGYITDPDQFPVDATEDYTTTWLRNSLRQAIDGVSTRDDDRWTFAVGYTADGSQHLEESLVAAGLRTRLGEVPPALRGELDALIERALPRAGQQPSEYLPHMVGRKAMRGLLPPDTVPIMIDTACSSSVYAIDLGIRDLLSGATDIAACGGAFGLAPRGSVLFAKLHGLSKSGRVRSMDEDSDGALFSDGAAVVVLKTLRRARADGDRVLGILAGIGASSDGKGKAIYAPQSAGQQIAVLRAHQLAGTGPADVDWVVAHATGTPAGDQAEFDALRTTMRSGRPTFVTSSKSLIGHTGWAAGVVSLVEVLLAFQHGRIPPQYEFDKAPPEFGIGESNLEIPTTVREWPAGARPRVAAVSAFGFGGTNAHLIVRDRAEPGSAIDVPVAEEAVAVVAWSTALPGDPGRDEVAAWLRGAGVAPAAGYGDEYPFPPVSEVRIPRATLRSTDRCQMMMLRCVNSLAPQLSEFWSSTRATTGVFVGHLGPTRNSTLYALRCYLGHLGRAVSQSSALAHSPEVRAAFEAFEATVRSLVPPVNENSFPGMMPNIIAARVSNYFDFHGPNMTLDSGFPAGLTAVGYAVDSLRRGAVDLALAAGINGNSTPELRHILSPALAPNGEIAEGAFMVALVRESTARTAGLPVLGLIGAASGEPAVEISCDATRSDRSYLGGDGVKALIEAVTRPEPIVRVSVSDPLTGQSARITVSAPTAVPDPESTVRALHRHVVRLVQRPLEQVRPTILDIDDKTLAVTDSASLARQLAGRGAMVVCTDPDVEAASRIHPLSVLSNASFSRLPADWHGRIRHLRVVSALPDPAAGVAESTLGLHDATFLALRELHPALTRRQGSFGVLLLSAMSAGAPLPAAGMFTGLTKSIALELPAVQCFSVLSSTDELGVGLAQLAAESSARQLFPVVVYDGDSRRIFVPIPEPVSAAEQIGLGRSSVIVAIGGGRGITAECAIALAANSGAKVWVLGSNPLDTRDDGTLIENDGESRRGRSEFIREGLRGRPGVSVAALSKEFDRVAHADTVRANLARIAAHSGSDRVRYLTCDVGDHPSILRAIRTIHDEDGRIDLLFNGAGLHRGGALAETDLADFRRIRDIKVRGYDNLNRAFAEAGVARPAVWCNFGSTVGFIGQPGEADYAAGNEFLSFASAYAGNSRGRDEVTIGWALWRDTGLAASPLAASFLQRLGVFTPMTTAEGVAHFLDELRLPRRYPSVVLIGDAERATIGERAPGLLDRPDRTVQPFFFGRRLVDEPNRIVAERTLDLTTDSYLADHLVNGVPTLPGTFVTAIVADAALALLPGWKVTAMSDLIFKKFLRVYPGRAGTEFRIIAERCSGTGAERTVTIRVVSDIRAPDGRTLRRDQPHFEATAHLRRERPIAPYRQRIPIVGSREVADPYHVSNEAVHLTGSLVSTTSTRVHSAGSFAEFSLPQHSRHGAFGRFRVPAVLLDGLARTAVLTPDRYIPLAAPLSIARIDFYDDRNDVELAEAFPSGLQLYCTGDVGIEDENGFTEFGVISPEGCVLLEMSGVRGTILGYVDTATAEFITPSQLKQL
ncbi:SDR family oxidoreductase [Nocardia sp. SYP-A9097]|uniref:SDR family oxidoreductase n=1 Tax=Nocardia sp. SYP-A9097 TaxID=2663237 RepID=UPI00129B3FF5|nr:SDR family oxidoreductase [Nocardia sp. SYP-A9097]MRH92064.1 SDR family oxidoreductase [Nocardia sp. SYP-A9097]